jgi:apolipoprotein N-acyltransferase
VFWPENSSDIDPIRNSDAAQEISTAAKVIGAPILVGAVLQAPEFSVDNPVSTNTVLVWDPITGPGERHDKQIVQPFGEYLPMRSFFKHFSKYADRAGYFKPIDGDGVVHAGGIPVGVTTCWEVTFDRAARESVVNGAQLLSVPSNNALFGPAMSEQQLAFAKVRAVEHDRYTVVVGTTGISAVVAPDGHELARTNFFEPAYLDKQVHLKTDLTPATRWGPVVMWVLIAVGGAALVAGMLQNGRLTRRLRPRGTDKGAP